MKVVDLCNKFIIKEYIMKQLFAILTAMMIVFSFSACNENSSTEQTSKTESQSIEQTSETENISQTTSNEEDVISETSLDKQEESTENEDDKTLYSGREMYEEIIFAFIEADDELSRGWFDEDAQNLVKLIKGDTISSDASLTDLLKIYRGFDDIIEFTDYCIRDFFTVTDSYESTNGCVYNFFEAINQLEDKKFNGEDVVKTDSDGNVIGFDFDIAGGDKAIAEALDVSEEFITIMLHAATDAGFSVTFD